MDPWKPCLVRILLFKVFIRTATLQLIIKLKKFTRHSRRPKSFLRKSIAGCEFLRDMLAYNWDVIRRSRRCVARLAAENTRTVLVYGEKDIVEVLQALSFETPTKMQILTEAYESNKNFGVEMHPVERCPTSQDRIIVASLVNVEERVGRLRALGVADERIILLT